jgi:pimeloyl-ACP methyl ester carboxylesterase
MKLHIHRGGDSSGDAALLVLHDLSGAGSDWQDVLDAWPGPSAAPDLPGHGQSPPAEGGKYVPTDFTLAALRALQQLGWDGHAHPIVVLGHGWGGFAAEPLAAAGRAVRLVLVDGLGGPWRSAAEVAASQTAWLRAALHVHREPPASPDPIFRLGFPDVWHEATTRGRRAAIAVPVLAIETPASPTPPDEREARVAMFGGPALLRAGERDQVAELVCAPRD